MELAALLARAHGLVRPGQRVVVGIAGMPGAGKSTFAAALVERLNAGAPPVAMATGSVRPVEEGDDAADRPIPTEPIPTGRISQRPNDGEWAALLPMDGFHLPQARLLELGLRDRMGTPQTFDAAAYARVIAEVAGGRERVSAPAFDRTVEEPQPGGVRIERWHRLVVTEGNYLLLPTEPWVAARRWMAEVWYLRVAEPVRLQRLVARHVEFGKSPEAAAAWVTRVDQPNARLVARYADAADLVVDLS